MTSLKKLAEKYLQGELSEMDKERLLFMIKNDNSIDAWLRASIEMADEVMPESIRNRVISNVYAASHNTASSRSCTAKSFFKRAVASFVIAVVAMCMGAFLYHYFVNTNSVTGMLEVATNMGERSTITLPDGTLVTLNAKTTLQYDCSLSEGVRKAIVNGEAFFDVAKDTKHPFIVCANDVEIECLGTAFNVRNHEEESTVSVVLVDGKVRVQAGESELTMEPNNRIVFDKHTMALAKHHVESSNYLCWLNNEVRYNNQTLEEIVGELARNYNMNIIITSDELRHERFTGYLGKSSLRNVLEVLSLTSGVKYYYDTDAIYLNKSR